MDWSAIISHIVTFLVGLGAGWTVRIVVSNRSTKSSRTMKVNQRGNLVGGDMVGGDMHKHHRDEL
jgi:hypothetical protein